MIITQILGGIALIIDVVAILLNNKKKYFIAQIITYVFNGAAFIVNNSLVAGINTFISITRAFILYIYEKKGKKPPFWLLGYSVIYIIVGIVFMQNYLEIITMITPILFTLSMLMKNMQLVRYYSMLPNAMLSTYSILTGAYTSAAHYIAKFIASIVAIITHHIQKKREIYYLL